MDTESGRGVVESSEVPHLRPSHSAADRKRHEILLKAAELFDESGYHLTSMIDIAEAVGVRKPTLYHYFRTKDEILFWIHEDYIDALLTLQEERLTSGLSPEELVAGMMRDILTLIHSRKGHVRAFYEHHRELTDDRRVEIMEKRDRFRHLFETAITAGVKRGHFREVDPVLTTLAIVGSVSWAYHWYGRWEDISIDQIGDAFVDLILNGLRAPDAGPDGG